MGRIQHKYLMKPIFWNAINHFDFIFGNKKRDFFGSTRNIISRLIDACEGLSVFSTKIPCSNLFYLCLLAIRRIIQSNI